MLCIMHDTSSVSTPCHLLQVREAVLTSALLRLPSSMSRKQKESRVDHILEELV